jgi:beta-lactam-binding protein with PASTA domain
MAEPSASSDSDAWPTRENATGITTREELAPLGPREPLGPPPSDRRLGEGMLLGLAALALVAIGVAVAYLLTHRNATRSTTVIVRSGSTTGAAGATGFAIAPDVRGLRVATASAQLHSAGFSTAETTALSTGKAGTVLRQVPRPGSRARKGSTILLVVATAGATKSTPTVAPATTSGSNPATTPRSSTTNAPASTVAAPPTPTRSTVPDVAGSNEQQAADELSSAGILPSLVFVPSSDPLGTVEQQAKPAGTVVPYHAHVQLNISNGPSTTTDLTIPNTIGGTLSEAVTTLNGAGLRLIYVKLPITSRAEAGKVVQQSPLAGGRAPGNGQVLVFLGAYRSRP